jgi:hypothetical protein
VVYSVLKRLTSINNPADLPKTVHIKFLKMGNNSCHVCEKPVNLRSEWERRQTFPKNWPYYDYEALARVGFIYTGYKDVVQWCYCKLLLQTDMVDDVTWIAHRRHRSKCPFMHGEDVGNIYLPLPIDDVSETHGVGHVSVDISDPVDATQKSVAENPCVFDDVRKIDLRMYSIHCAYFV